MNILTIVILNNTVFQWLVALAVFILSLLLLLLVRGRALARTRARAEITNQRVDDIVFDLLSRTRFYALLALSLYLATLPLSLSPGASVLLRSGAFILLILQMAVWGSRLITIMVDQEVRRRVGADDQSSTIVNLVGFFSRIALWVIVILVVLDNLPNVEVTSLIASLGITGVAVALAVQNILRDLFASLSIALDRPFVIGDYIIIDQHQGTVEDIGLKSTRIRSLFGEQIIVSNSDLLNSRIQNFKRMKDRRVTFNLKVPLEIPIEQVTRIPLILADIIRAQSPVRFDRAHLKSVADGALNFEVVYYVLSPDYDEYMDVHQNINLGVLNRFTQEGIPIL